MRASFFNLTPAKERFCDYEWASSMDHRTRLPRLRDTSASAESAPARSSPPPYRDVERSEAQVDAV